MNLRTMIRPRTSGSVSTGARRRPPIPSRRPALLLGAATAGALLVNVLAGGEPAAQADSQLESVSIAEQLGITSDSAEPVDAEAVAPLEQLAASRAERQQEQATAAAAQSAANQAELDARAALVASREELARRQAAAEASRQELARRQAEAQAAAEAAAEAAAAEAAAAPAPAEAAPAAAPAGSFQDYALAQLGGDANEFSCLESLWGRESGWNPNAQNPSSTAYGIPQFLDSTWAGTGIAKTSDGYRQIDAGLIYINSRYGSPCGAWGHSQSSGWY